MTSPRSSHLTAPTTRRRIVAMLAALASIFFVLPSASQASSLHLHMLSSSSGSDLTVQVDGARKAKKVALFVDGRLRGRDRSYPWTFGRSPRIALASGRHTVVASARFANRSRRASRTVLIAARHTQKTRGHTTVTSSSRHSGSGVDVSPRRRVSSPPPTEAPPPPAPEPEATPTSYTDWHGDYETGNLSQWEAIQEVAPDRITVSHEMAHQGNYAARFEVRPGDNIGDTPPRAEVASDLHEKEGEERYYRWYTYFPESFPTEYPNSFVTFTQWRAKDESTDYTSFMVWGDQIQLRREGTKWSTTLTKGVWHKFVYHVKWSPDPSTGFIELYYDGQLVVPKTNVRTMAGTPGHAVGNYVKEGLYRSDELPTGVLYQDGFVAETSFAAANEAQ